MLNPCGSPLHWGALTPAGSAPRCAVVGAGLAGVAAAWHLLALAVGQGRRLVVDLYDAAGLGAGASGAAAGLLHPFSPRGKVLWRGEEALSAALDLVAIAESGAEAAGAPEPFVWRQPLYRPATDPKQAQAFARVQLPQERAVAGAWSEVARREAVLTEEGGGPEGEQGLLVHGGLVLDLRLYLRWVWAAAQELAVRQPGSGAALRRECVASLAALQAERGPYHDVLLATGAAVNSLAGSTGRELPLTLSQGYTLRLAPPPVPPAQRAGGHLQASLLGSTYAAVQGERTVVVGSTRRDVTLAEAEAACGRAVPLEEAQQAAGELLPRAKRLTPALGEWQVDSVQSGVRAQPAPTPKGSIPLAGLLSDPGPGGGRVWAMTGLGARGLLYHAWLGRQLAAALLGGGGEAALDPELRRWQQPP